MWVSVYVVFVTYRLYIYGFCNVLFCVCVGFVICGWFDNCVGVLVICVLEFIAILNFSLYIFILIFYYYKEYCKRVKTQVK